MEQEKLKSFFLALYSMVLADGIVEAKELESLYRIGRENYNLTSEEINKYVVSAGTTFIVPDRLEDRISLLYDLAEVAWADGEIDETERTLLARYVVRLGFLEENADEITHYMLKQVKDGISKEDVINEIVNA